MMMIIMIVTIILITKTKALMTIVTKIVIRLNEK